MPCTKCKEGKYKWGETGECEYATKEDCESANHKYNKMQPTPLGKTYEEYAKELKEFNLSKVELSVLGDVEKQTKKINSFLKIYTNLSKELKKAANVVEEAKKLNDDGYDLHNKSSAIGSKFIKAAKELGVDFDTPEFREYAKASAELSKINGEVLKLLPR
tara:strand:+ start:19 stop:501 length:483 start_codon:yes stop_codon:yes gene_type:complete